MAAAAAIAGLTRWVRPPAPWRPSKFRLLVDAQRSPGSSRSAFIARHIEQPGSRHSNPAALNTTSRPSCSACCLTSPEPGTPMEQVRVDKVFIGSCTNARIEDLRVVARLVEGKRVSPTVRAMIVPGSGLVKHQAEAEGLDEIFTASGFEWREPGCSMCLGMNPDQLKPGQRAASTSNRNFEGRQGFKGRTHLVSPQMAAAAALVGHFVDVRQMG